MKQFFKMKQFFIKPKQLMCVPLFLTASFLSASQSSAFAQVLLPQGTFDQVAANNKPGCWEILWGPEKVSTAGDAKNRWVQLGDGAVLNQVVKLPERSKTLVVSARLKLSNYEKGPEGWHRARVSMTFQDDTGKMVGTYPAIPDLTANSDWVTKEVTVQVPPEATRLQLQPGLWGSKGLFEIDDLTVKVTALAQVVPPVVAADAPWPAAQKVAWGSEPVEVQSSKRARVSLNGAWKFSPPVSVTGQANTPPEKGWGYLGVPGNWRRHQEIIARGTGPQWTGLDLRSLAGAWYERRFKVPADWNGRHISIDVDRISTDATFWINDKPAGKVNFPEGEIDITNLVKAGEEVTLRAFVVATIEPGDVLVMMGEAPGQNWTAKRELQTAGLVGNVTLQSRPRGAYVSDVYIQPSFRKKQLALDVELSGVTQNGPVQLVASMLDENGKEEKRFTQTVNATAGATQRVTANWAWDNPRLWDYKQPNLYTLRLTAKGAGLDDEPATKFGFRETWIEGRQVMLNGTPFRMRPFLLGTSAMGGGDTLSDAFELGYNFGEIWPEGTEERSTATLYTSWYDAADRGGMPISGMTPHMGWMGGNFNNPTRQAAYRAATERVLRRHRNHPSIIMWGTSGNMIGSLKDPAYIGTIEASRKVEAFKDTPSSRAIPLADLGVSMIKSIDPTRPVFVHNGGSAGDIYTSNHYLNFIPLQEREEWLSNYAVNGQMPLAYVEFGTPVNISIMRGRNGFQNAYRSENWLTEFASIYLGNDAYKLETAEFRNESAKRFIKDQEYEWAQGMASRDTAPSWMQLQDLFIRNTWRTWRTMGMTGGMVPWDRGYAKVNGKLTPAGEALRASNSDTLAWIVGAAQTGDVAAFTAKDHAYLAGEAVRKQIALINDSRNVQKYVVRWTATLDGKTISQGEKTGDVVVGKTLFLPIEFAAPATASKVGGEITLDATIGEINHTDRFAFRVWPRAVASRGNISVFDPEGKSSAMLRALGYTVSPWNGRASNQLLFLGRNALKTGTKLPGDLKAFVSNGGRVLFSGHDPHWLREYLGLRVSYHQSRRVFKVGENAATVGIDEVDLRDWRGHSTLLNPRPDYVNGKGPDELISVKNLPYAGWRWGNRGTVASAAVEKPHRSGWRPLLEAEFDLQYSPLMELDYGKGKIVWSQLDLEDHAALEPAANRLARQVINYATTAPLAPRVAVSYIGGETGSALLNSLGVQFKTLTSLPASGVVVVGADATIAPAQLETFARGGGKVLFLARKNATGAAGLQLTEKKDFIGSLQAPDWAEARGLSASDLRWRAAGSAWVASAGEGWQIGADGLLARRVVGNGVMVASQIDPTLLPADEKTYFRFTRWRQTRALSQVLANLGASFISDENIFSPRAPEKVKEPITVALAGDWRAKQIQRLPASPSPDKGHVDAGISAEAKQAVAPDFGDAAWQTVQVPRDMDSYGPTWKDADGEAVFRKVIEVPRELQGQDLKLSFGSVDDYDETYFNGVRVGGIGKENPTPWSAVRDYTIPANLIKPGKNVIAVRVWDRFGGGGITGTANTMLLQSPRLVAEAAAAAAAVVKPPSFYHPDYRADFELGDEPYRYYNW
jgi:beta-galactosidase